VILRRLIADAAGATAVEFGLTAPVFFAMMFGLIDGGMLLWTQLGLQHATEMAARCASINKNLCAGTTAVQSYASTQALGLSMDPSVFTFTQPSCGSQVNASFDFGVIGGYYGTPVITINAVACFPK
jgi:Flp pilus assembly protein TadG